MSSRDCPHCGVSFELSEGVLKDGGVRFKEHVRACFFEKKGESRLVNKDSDLDWIVQQRELKEEIEYRMNLFRSDRGLDGTVFMRENLTMLTKRQFDAIEVVRVSSEKLSLEVTDKLLGRLLKMGFDITVVGKISRYLRDYAPLLIHLHVDKHLGLIINDGHYRSLFETNTGSGGTSKMARADWEKRMFQGRYDGCRAVERCKYGVQNILRDPAGVTACYGYGNSYFVLRNVRMRTTFSNMDTASSAAAMATCENYLHVLDTYNESELRAVANVATGRSSFESSGILASYKEVQYHGPVRLAEDIECLVVNDSFKKKKNVLDELSRFESKFKRPWYWMSDYAKLMNEKVDMKKDMNEKVENETD